MKRVQWFSGLLTLCLCAAALPACAAGAMAPQEKMMAPMSATAMDGNLAEMDGKALHGASSGKQATEQPMQVAQAPAPVQPRKVVYTGSYTVDVYDLQSAAKEWVAWAEKVGGYMEQTVGSRVTVRIPAEHFSGAKDVLARIGRIDDRLTSVKAEDVTARYVDMELRLKTKRDYLAQLKQLQASAGELKDKLAVQQEIARVVEEIEAMEGQLRLLAKKISLSTIEVTFRLATAGPKRQFRLPWEWLDMIGLERLMG